MDDNLDMNWIDQEEKKITMNYGFIREPMKKIRINYVYIHDDSIHNIETEEYPLMDETNSGSNQIIPNEHIIHLIESHKNKGNVKHKIVDMLLFNVALESVDIQKYIHGEEKYNSKFLKTVSVSQDIVIEPSIFIFHNINTIYMFFKEIEKTRWLKTAITNKLRPILKSGRDMRKTKKRVCIDLSSNILFDENY